MKRVSFKDRVGRTFSVESEVGKTIKQILDSNNIPTNAVICRNKGLIITEDHMIDEDDDIKVEMVRFYDLPKILAKRKIVRNSNNPIYQKEIISFNAGDVERKVYKYNENEIGDFIENIFIDFIKLHGLIIEGDKIAVGFSGGKDSLALLLLLYRLKRKFPKFELSAITVAGWEDPTSFDYTKDICRKLNIEQHIVNPKQIEEIFGLKQSLFDTLSKIDSNEKYNVHTIYFLHQFMRRGIEEKAKSIGINKIFLGLNLEDLFSSFLGFFTTGYDILDFPQREIGDLTFGFPLFPLTKKEISLYVNITAMDFSNQGPTTAFDKGPVSRGFYYYISDKLQDLWPGIEHHVLAGFNKIKTGREKPKHKKCTNCKTTFLLQSKEKTKEEKCEVCKLLEETSLI